MLLSLDEAVATPIIAELEPDDLRKLREVATMMRAVPASALSGVYAEFLEKSREAIAVPKGGIRYLRRVATKALGESKAQEIFLEGPHTAMERLGSSDPVALSVVLENEHPQLVAAILSQLPQDKALALLEQLPDERRAEALERLGNMTEVPAGLLEEVAAALSAELPSSEVEAVVSVDGIARSAALIRRMDRQTGEALLGRLASGGNDGLAAEIRRAMYSFDDLLLLDARGLRAVLEAVPSERLAVALKTASAELQAHIFSGMSKRAADRIREDIEVMGSVRLADVEAAQREIVEQCLKLAAEGVISLEADVATV